METTGDKGDHDILVAQNVTPAFVGRPDEEISKSGWSSGRGLNRVPPEYRRIFLNTGFRYIPTFGFISLPTLFLNVRNGESDRDAQLTGLALLSILNVT
jgi:hypothetical protein